jgi:hypothetical protein
VIDGQEGPSYDMVLGTLYNWADPPRFSPDSQHVAYMAIHDNQLYMIVDGKEGDPYEAFGLLPVFSENSQRLAYSAGGEGKWRVVVDGVEGEEYDMIGLPILTNTGQMATSPILSFDNHYVAYPAQRGDDWFVVINDQEGNAYDELFWLTADSDNNFYYLARKVQSVYLVTQTPE